MRPPIYGRWYAGRRTSHGMGASEYGGGGGSAGWAACSYGDPSGAPPQPPRSAPAPASASAYRSPNRRGQRSGKRGNPRQQQRGGSGGAPNQVTVANCRHQLPLPAANAPTVAIPSLIPSPSFCPPVTPPRFIPPATPPSPINQATVAAAEALKRAGGGGTTDIGSLYYVLGTQVCASELSE